MRPLLPLAARDEQTHEIDKDIILRICERLTFIQVFLDDIGANLKAASKLGIHTIKVDFRTTPEAIEELRHLLQTDDIKAHL